MMTESMSFNTFPQEISLYYQFDGQNNIQKINFKIAPDFLSQNQNVVMNYQESGEKLEEYMIHILFNMKDNRIDTLTLSQRLFVNNEIENLKNNEFCWKSIVRSISHRVDKLKELKQEKTVLLNSNGIGDSTFSETDKINLSLSMEDIDKQIEDFNKQIENIKTTSCEVECEEKKITNYVCLQKGTMRKMHFDKLCDKHFESGNGSGNGYREKYRMVNVFWMDNGYLNRTDVTITETLSIKNYKIVPKISEESTEGYLLTKPCLTEGYLLTKPCLTEGCPRHQNDGQESTGGNFQSNKRMKF